jgi:F-type H+-transporting ATPase subunit b
MVDIADKLFPNIMTILVQLAATGVIYLLYRKYVHEHVLNYLDNQAAELNRAQLYAEEVEEEADQKSQALQAEHEAKKEQLRKQQELMRREAEEEKQAILQRAEAERNNMLQQAQVKIEKDRQDLLTEVEKHVLDLAVDVTEKTLERYSYDEEEIFRALESELEQMNNETN